MKVRLLPYFLVAGALVLSSCRDQRSTLVLLVGPDEPAPTIAILIRETFRESASIRIEVRPGGSESENLDALHAGFADLTIATDLGTFRDDLRTLVSLYPGILHLLHTVSPPPPDFDALLKGRRVFAGPVGGIGRRVLTDLASEAGTSLDRVELIDSPWEEDIEVYVSIGGVLDRSSLRDLPPELRLFSFDEMPRSRGTRVVDGLALRFPYLRPFEIPSRLYGGVRREPATTVALHSLLISRPDLPRETAYLLSKTIVERRATLRSSAPILHQGLNEDFDPGVLGIPLHAGASDYYQRREPSFVERYSETIGLVLSLIVALASVLYALRNWTRQRRKDRIDGYYEEILQIRDAQPRPVDVGEVAERVDRIQQVERRAFEQLIAERLDANESFRIFLSLCRDAITELRAQAAKANGERADREMPNPTAGFGSLGLPLTTSESK